MKVLNHRLIILILTIGLLSACGSQPAVSTSASQPTEAVATSTQTLVNTPAPTDTQPSALSSAAESSPTSSVSFANDILPILNSRCINCHGGDRTEKGLNLKNYGTLMEGSENGSVVTSGNADQSKLAELVINQKMPKRGPKLTPPQIQLIIDWINQGALNN